MTSSSAFLDPCSPLTATPQPISRLVGAEDKQRFLRFSLSSDLRAVVALNQLQEVIRVQVEEILPLPCLAPWVLGIYSWRGDIAWIVDLQGLVAMEPLAEAKELPRQISALVMPSGEQMLGLAVERVEAIEGQDPGHLHSLQPGMIPDTLGRYVKGYFIDAEGTMLLQLDGEAIGQVLADSAPSLSSEVTSVFTRQP